MSDGSHRGDGVDDGDAIRQSPYRRADGRRQQASTPTRPERAPGGAT